MVQLHCTYQRVSENIHCRPTAQYLKTPTRKSKVATLLHANLTPTRNSKFATLLHANLNPTRKLKLATLLHANLTLTTN